LVLTSADRETRPWEVRILASTCGLPHDSIALPQQIRTISSARVRGTSYGRLVDATLRKSVADQILRHLSLQDLARLELEE